MGTATAKKPMSADKTFGFFIGVHRCCITSSLLFPE
jgi:hypothetical protein